MRKTNKSKGKNKSKGVKFDGGKPRLELIPPEAQALCGQVLTMGAQKYAARNWEKGLAWGRVIGALKRHLELFAAGVDMDPDNGLSNIGGILCNASFLAAYWARGTGDDDRPRLTEKQKQVLIDLLAPMKLPEAEK